MSKPFCVLLSQLSSQKYLWAGKPFWLLMCDWALFVSCRIVFGFCFCWSFVPNYPPAGALYYVLMVGHLPHRLFPRMLHLRPHFPRLSCSFLSLPCSDLLIFPLLPFSIVLFSFGDFFPPFCFISLGYSLLPLIPLWLFAKCRTSSGVGQHVFLQLLCESRRDILDIEAAVCLSLCMHELRPWAIDLLWEPRENGKGIWRCRLFIHSLGIMPTVGGLDIQLCSSTTFICRVPSSANSSRISSSEHTFVLKFKSIVG